MRIHPLRIRVLEAGGSRHLLLLEQTGWLIMNVDASTGGGGWLPGTKTAALVPIVGVGKPCRMSSCTEDDDGVICEREFKKTKRTFRKTFCKEIL